jgi:hypothetical protein
MVPVAPIITGVTCAFTFHMRRIYIIRSLYFRIFFVSFFIAFLSRGIATSISIHVPFSVCMIMMSGHYYCYYYYVNSYFLYFFVQYWFFPNVGMYPQLLIVSCREDRIITVVQTCISHIL